MKVPFVDLGAQHRALRKEILEAVTAVIDRTAFILGEEVDAFEEDFASYQGVDHAVGVASGLDALTLALRAMDVGVGDEVVVPANTFVATALAVSQVGATPVLVDVDPLSFNLDPGALEEALTGRTRAVIPVHLYGQIADVDAIGEIAQNAGLMVIEDAAQAHGAEYMGKRAGAWGRAACFSFYPAKNLGALGDGGAVLSNDEEIVKRLRLLRNYGSERKYEHVAKGVNSRLDTLQAAALRVKLRHLDKWNEQRRWAAKIYGDLLGDTGVLLPSVGPERRHVYHLFVVRVSDPVALQAYLASRGIGAGFHYPRPIHLLDAYSDLGRGRGSFPVTEAAADTIVSLPMYPEIKEAQLAYVCEQVKSALASGVTTIVDTPSAVGAG